MVQIEKWDIFETEVAGKCDGNPFMDASVSGTFTCDGETVTVDGFYDGDGIYRVRFMPGREGIYTYRIEGSALSEAVEGSFEAVAPGKENHGPVIVREQTHLGYSDGTPHYSIGTTCYAWLMQSMELQEQTLESLKQSPFNKIRFCVFPKYYLYNKHEPLTYPFERGHGEGLDPELVKLGKETALSFADEGPTPWDLEFNYYRPNVEHFKRFDLRIRQLRDMGIETDIILMHPYDCWGMNMMNKESCDAYLRYMVARYGAYRNVWWSLANEYDLIRTKTLEDWERYAAVIGEKDVYGHLCSVHNCMAFYDFTKPWTTHCSMQRIDFYRHVEYTDEYIEKYQKPVVWDEIGYEGNIEMGWGNLTGQELVRRFWEAFLRGGHAGHGETFIDPKDILWWSHGGRLKGDSVLRLRFLKDILSEVPGGYLKHAQGMFDETVAIAAGETQREASFFEPQYTGYEIRYYGINQPALRKFYLPEDQKYRLEIIDTWNMTVTDAGVHSGITAIPLPQKPYIAVRLTCL